VTTHGLLLAAGAGRRYGGPKALVDGWLRHALDALADGGCADRTVVLGAEAEQVRPLVPAGVAVVVADDWAEGMGASLRAGLAHLPDAEAVVVHLVDLPDVGAEVVRRVLATGAGPATLARATYGGVPGHPVLLGRDHWPGVLASAAGDQGARAYLATHDVTLVECGDLATGRDVDR
jgi:CTP:molybdopterin cytidylyltransferase MocA